MKLDILAIAAHPDDAELSCSGILALHKELGFKTGILDLTRGELGSRGTPEIRAQECAHSSEILQLDIRENLGYRDGFFKNDEEHQLGIIRILRKYQPNIVLINAPYDRHPDHGKGAQLAKDACFLSGLVKIETHYENQVQPAWRPKRIFHYIQDQHIEPDFIIDISSVFDKKMKSIQAFSSQFYTNTGDGPKTYISSQQFLNFVEGRCQDFGKRIGVQYGEGLLNTAGLGLKSLEQVILPEIS